MTKAGITSALQAFSTTIQQNGKTNNASS